MFCLQRFWSVAELKQHISSYHTIHPSHGSVGLKEERKEELDGTDIISNLLGTKRAVVDRLLSSKSADDAAKLLGVR